MASSFWGDLGKAVIDALSTATGATQRQTGAFNQPSTRLTAGLLGVSLDDTVTQAVGTVVDGALGAFNKQTDEKLTNFARTTDKEGLRVMLTGNDRLFYINSKTEDGLTALHIATSMQNYTLIEVFLETMDTDSDADFELLSVKDKSNRAFFHPPSQSPLDINVIKLIATGLNCERFEQLMMLKGDENMTCLHSAIQHLQVDAMKLILKQLELGQRMGLLNIEDSAGEKPLEKLIRMIPTSEGEQKTVIRTVLGLLDVERGLDIARSMLMMVYHTKNTGVGLRQMRIRIVNIVINSLSTELQMRLVGAKSVVYQKLLSLEGAGVQLEEDIELLQKVQGNSRLELALQELDKADQENKIIDLLEHESLTADQLGEVFLHIKRYPIPYNQGSTKQYAIILYNLENREGGEEEAQNLEQAFIIARFEIFKHQWAHTYEIGVKLDDILTEITGGCSILTVCIMSHGFKGTLTGSQESKLTINDVLKQLRVTLPENLPLVSCPE